MDTFVFETNAVRSFTKFQAPLTKDDTQNILFPHPSVAPSFHLRLVTYVSARITKNDLH